MSERLTGGILTAVEYLPSDRYEATVTGPPAAMPGATRDRGATEPLWEHYIPITTDEALALFSRIGQPVVIVADADGDLSIESNQGREL